MRIGWRSVPTLLCAAATLHASLASADDEAAAAPPAPSEQVAGDTTAPPAAPGPEAADDDGTAASVGSEASPEAAIDDSARTTEPPTTPAPDAAVETPKPGRSADPVRLAQIERDLVLVRDEETSTTRLLPMLTIALGVATVVTAATVGVAQALSCNGTCHADSWQGVTLIGGAAVATVGMLWLRWTDGDIRELGTRRYRLERERDDIGKSMGEPRSARPARPRALVLGVRGQF